MIAVVVEHLAGRIAEITRDQVECAWQVASFIGAKPHAIIIGDDVQASAEYIASKWGIETTAVHVATAQYYQLDTWLAALEPILRRAQTRGIILGHTTNGMELAPSLAVRLQTNCISGVDSLEFESKRLFFQRSMFGGKICARISPHPGCWVITIQPGAFQPLPRDVTKKATIRRISVEPPSGKMRFLGLHTTSANRELQQAKIVVGGGRGIGKKDNLKLLSDLASAFPGGVVGGSRPLCDAGWLDYGKQIGLTGNTVHPNLYFACGISGAFQHVVGMRESDFVVAINTDPNAAIFNHADVSIIGDLVDFLPILTDKLKEALREKLATMNQPQAEPESTESA